MNGASARKLLERMRATKSGWGQGDFERLLTGFGFTYRDGKKHRIYSHSAYGSLIIGVPRHGKLKKWVAEDAVKRIDELLKLNAREESDEPGKKGP